MLISLSCLTYNRTVVTGAGSFVPCPKEECKKIPMIAKVSDTGVSLKSVEKFIFYFLKFYMYQILCYLVFKS